MSNKVPGRKREFSLKKLTKLFKKHEEDIVLDDGKILRPGDEFWSTFKKKYSIPTKERNIYTDAWK